MRLKSLRERADTLAKADWGLWRRFESMHIAVEMRHPRTVLCLVGDLDADAGPGLYLTFQRELSRGGTQFTFDLDRVGLVDSAGLGVLVRCYRDARMRGGTVHLERVPPPIARLLEFTRLDAILPVLTPEAAEARPAA